MKKLIDFLKSNESVLIATILSLATQLWHSVEAFVRLEPGDTKSFWIYLFGVFFSASTSFAILVFTVRGRKNIAYFYLAVEVFINLIFYQVNGIPDTYVLISTLFMCIIVPVTIAIYSSEIDISEEQIGMNDDAFIFNLSQQLGFDVMVEGKSRIDNDTRNALTAVWRERKNKATSVLKKEIQAILNHGKGEAFFKPN